MDQNKNQHHVGFHQYENYSPHHPVTPLQPKRTQAINAWLHKHRIPVLITLVIVIFCIAGAFIYGVNNLTFYASTGDPIVIKKQEKKTYSPLTGSEVSETESKRPVTAIMIENSPEARPQSGLKDAGVVFEAIAEGGITRFLTLHQEGRPEIIGPVRSLRPYYIDWLAAFDPSVAHVGGSVKALSEIRNGSYKDIDQFSNAAAYWRAKDRYAPHNVYTSFERLDALNNKKGYTSSTFTGFPRKDDPAVKKRPTATATTITVPISAALYNASYSYNAETNSYTRSQGGKAHIDREHGAITPKVVIVIQAPLSQVFEDGLRESYKTIGSGKAFIFQDGTETNATWSKTSKTSQITFKDASDKPIKLNRGQTWITVVDSSKAPTWQ